MNRDYLVYSLISSFIGCILWTVSDVVFESIGLSYFGGPTSIFLLLPVSAAIGTFVGLAYIGKIRKPSFRYGILHGLITDVIFSLIYSIFNYILRFVGHWSRMSILAFINTYVFFFIVSMPFIFLGVFVGIVIVRRTSASFCPHCGAELPAGRSPCPQCGKSP
jgi:hypothetical protein